MKLIVLAAGAGRRMEHLAGTPKGLLELAPGQRLLDVTLEAAEEIGCFDSLVVATGYKSSLVEEALLRFNPRYRFNPFFFSFTTIGTLWLMRDEMQEDFAVVAGDVIMTIRAFENLIDDKNGPGVIVAHWEDGFAGHSYAGHLLVRGEEAVNAFRIGIEEFVKHFDGAHRSPTSFTRWLAEYDKAEVKTISIAEELAEEIDLISDLERVQHRRLKT